MRSSVALVISVLQFNKHIITVFEMCWIVHHCDKWRVKNQLDATYYFIILLKGSTCFRHYYAHHQELATVMLITTLVVPFCRDGRGSVNVKLWFLVVYMFAVKLSSTTEWQRTSHQTYTTKNHNFTLTPSLPPLQKEKTNVAINIIIVSSWWWV